MENVSKLLLHTYEASNIEYQIKQIKRQILSYYTPSKIILFGSLTKGTATKKSDIDICIIKNTDKKRELLTDMYLNIESNRPFDLLVYTESEWEECIKDKASFAYLINNTGVVLYG
jgi:predicted nucleotidyltransferase